MHWRQTTNRPTWLNTHYIVAAYSLLDLISCLPPSSSDQPEPTQTEPASDWARDADILALNKGVVAVVLLAELMITVTLPIQLQLSNGT